MNETRSALVFALLASVVACSADESSTMGGAPIKAGTSEAAATGPSGATAAADPNACPSDVPAATRLVPDGSATSLQVVGDQVYYQTQVGVMKVGLDGSGPTTVFTSPTLTHAWVDGASLLVVESPNAPDAVVRVIPLADAPKADASTADKLGLDGTQVALPTTWNAGGTKTVAADGTSFYVVADEATGQAVYALTHGEAPALTKIAAAEAAVLTSVQVTKSALWFVRDTTRVFMAPHNKIEEDGTLTFTPVDEETAPKEQFTVDAEGCSLAIAGTHAFCVRPSSIEQRDLDGKNMTPLLELTKSKVQPGFGAGIVAGDKLVLRSGYSDVHAQRAVIRELGITGGASEKILACGRTPIGALAASTAQVVWTEQGKNAGIWSAPR